MGARSVTVIDYGIGNLLNVVRALQHCGASVRVVQDAAGLHAMPERLVLPGVGAFIGGMVEMRQRGLDDLMRRFAATGRPLLVSRHGSDVVGCAQPSERSARRIAQPIPSVLASDATPRCAPMASADRQMISDATLDICVGAQMLFDAGQEFGEHPGLGLLAGRVQPVPEATPSGGRHRIPHIGWSALVRPPARATWAHSPLAQMPEGQSMYFVHSFAPVPADEAHRLADTFYDGVRICAAVGRDNIWGCQFHPERSAEHGLGVLRSFLAL
ncbi:imidazole glycerol phosphate synthase, glutamine amidotransferase subunit [Verminephrobacter eiseniae EF01-2]|uniref:Imidazole glycerol phosphate synthase, glutamine amidotransferase subunit n=1 Tax=Verminephrobacter eiseniae (strain EF01-2) TaxID=391735 RepID=A1WSE4_VEREI|nr:imidazole glycerol phosphate synthase, glutamine amidotransferase subunit [Verminephrobacter eiseniae EF01-2]